MPTFSLSMALLYILFSPQEKEALFLLVINPPLLILAFRLKINTDLPCSMPLLSLRV